MRTGDVVLFRRGDLFRGILQTKSGVGYGAYGSGPKPRICGSLWNAAELHWETTDILHVYRCEGIYDRDAGLLIGDDGKLVGIKKLGGIEELQNDGDFFHAPDRHVYMRWSQGNPAECFKEIEIGINLHTVQLLNGQENITIENLNVCYTGAHGIAGGYCKNIVIRFCEFHWIGGSIQAGTVRYGNAVEFWASSDTVLVEHCYVSQVYDAGITHQAGGAKQVQMRHITYRYNLVEYCTFSFECYVRRRNKDGKILIDPECYMEDIRIGDLAKACHISETHFRRVFTSYMHMSPLEYINKVRIQTACEILKKTDESIADIAYKCGFTTNSTFNRNFRQLMGMSPAEWRKRPENYEQQLLKFDIHSEKGW